MYYRHRPDNEIIKKGNISYLVLYGRDGNEIAIAIIDSNSINLVKGKRWYLSSGYVRTHLPTGKREYLHHVIVGKHLSKVVDHINQNKLDNRRKNLRIVSKAVNLLNGKRKFLGVTFYDNRWIAQLGVKGKHMELGRFIRKADAMRCYREARRKYHGI